jgi:flagellar protein FliO/FliZ
VNGLLALALVLALVGTLAWVARRGGLGALAGKPGAIAVETAIGLGDRRSLVIVSVEGRRLLLGMTPTHLSLVTELDGKAATRVQSLSPVSANPREVCR